MIIGHSHGMYSPILDLQAFGYVRIHTAIGWHLSTFQERGVLLQQICRVRGQMLSSIQPMAGV